MSSLGRRHDLTAVSLITPDLDPEEARRAMGKYCREVVLIPAHPWEGRAKRLHQLRALLSFESYERRFYRLRALEDTLADLLSRRRFDLVNIEAPYLSQYRLARAPRGARPSSRASSRPSTSSA